MSHKDAIREYVSDEEQLEIGMLPLQLWGNDAYIHTARTSRRRGLQLAQIYEITGNENEITEALAFLHCAAQFTPDDHADMPEHLSNLGSAFLCRFQRMGDPSDISEAISAQRRAIQLTPNGHVNMPGLLSNLGNAFLCRFRSIGGLSNLSEAISYQQRAVQHTPKGHTNMPIFLYNLGVSLIRKTAGWSFTSSSPEMNLFPSLSL